MSFAIKLTNGGLLYDLTKYDVFNVNKTNIILCGKMFYHNHQPTMFLIYWNQANDSTPYSYIQYHQEIYGNNGIDDDSIEICNYLNEF